MRNQIIYITFIALTVFSCGKLPSNEQTSSSGYNAAAPSVRFETSLATLDPMGNPVVVAGHSYTSISRIRAGETIEAKNHALVNIDSGASVLLDAGGVLVPTDGEIELKKGRAWFEVDAAQTFKLKVKNHLLTCRKAAFDVEFRGNSIFIHHIRGDLNFTGKKPVQFQGGTWQIDGDSPVKVEGELFVDWTGGFSRSKKAGFGFGILRGKDTSGVGTSPLILRKHTVNVKVRKRIAHTTVVQVFFNPVSYSRNGEYRMEIPADAIIMDFAVEKNGVLDTGSVQTFKDGFFDSVDSGQSFYMLGDGKFGAEIPYMPVSAEVKIIFSYAQKLPEENGKRLYTYKMDGGLKASEFELSMRIEDSGSRLRSGWGGEFEKQRFVVSKSDFIPHSDFTAEIYPESPGGVLLEMPREGKKDIPFLLSLPMDQVSKFLKLKPTPSEGINIVALLDLSASMDSSRVQLLKTSFMSMLSKFKSRDKLAVYVLRNEIIPLDGAGLAYVTPERVKKLSESLSRMVPGGATDLGKALETAAVIIPRGEGTILYMGDGNPSRGAMTGDELKNRIAITDPPPLFRAIILGNSGNQTVLDSLGEIYTASSVRKVSGLFDQILKESASSYFKQVVVKLGNKSRKITPQQLSAAGLNQIHYVSGFITKPVPPDCEVSGWISGKPFRVKIPLKISHTSDTDIIKKLWAYSRVKDLISQGAGALNITGFSMSNQLITPLTGLSLVSTGFVQKIALPSGVQMELPRVNTFQFRMLKGRPPVDISGIALPDVDADSRSFNMSWYYQSILNGKGRIEAINECFNRKAVFMAVSGGAIVYEFEVEPDGRIKKAQRYSATITDEDILKCVERAVSVMPSLPANPGSKDPISFKHTWNFRSTGQIIPVKCTKLANAYTEVKKQAWTYAIGGYPNAQTCERVYRNALAGCEISDWISKKALLDLILTKLKMSDRLFFTTLIMDQSALIRNYIKERIFRSIKDVNEAFMVARHFHLGGSALVNAVKNEIAKLKKDKDFLKLKSEEQLLKIHELIASFHRLEPESVALTMIFMHSSVQIGKKDFARNLAEKLLWRNDLTGRQRRNLAEFLIDSGFKNEARLVISTSVELAPYDPLTRKQLGDFFYRHNYLEDALSDYLILTWLLPQNNSSKILLAQTRMRRGETELGLRLFEELMLKSGEKLARHLLILNLAQLYNDANRKGHNIEPIRARVRRNGLLEEEGNSILMLETLRGNISIQYTDRQEFEKYQEAVKKKAKPEEMPVLTWDVPPVIEASLGLYIYPMMKERSDIIIKVRSLQNPDTALEPTSTGELSFFTKLWEKSFAINKEKILPKHNVTYYWLLTKEGKLSLFLEKPDEPLKKPEER
ncbi:VIT and VWA domain-containing protein [Myxococcota bacterium]|nr:VIT and VWA domain-containing protein [Myxococcota bacterium]MBU1382740.1 VIT and VWA domain-containing protein [Myxococcota bacterium]MBU1498282.1 VIT and VWA domain-containing protein [Myxococcota bacterium]